MGWSLWQPASIVHSVRGHEDRPDDMRPEDDAALQHTGAEERYSRSECEDLRTNVYILA